MSGTSRRFPRRFLNCDFPRNEGNDCKKRPPERITILEAESSLSGFGLKSSLEHLGLSVPKRSVPRTLAFGLRLRSKMLRSKTRVFCGGGPKWRHQRFAI